MAAPSWIELFLGPLERVGIEYMVTGSVAATAYGEPRMTLDVDLVVALDQASARGFLAAFAESEFYRPPLEVVRVELAREARGHFSLIHRASGMKADVYIASNDALHRWGLAHRRRLRLGSQDVWLAPPEYVIVRKLEFWREGGSDKHLRDVRAMLASGTTLDRELLAREVDHRSLREAWARVADAS